jgi:pyruvate/2-oxoglutarate/acetoin dehydrogenase E1 component
MMQADSRVVMIGEDILDPYGGAFKVTKGLSTHFPERVFASPLSEGSIVGMAAGMAIRGLRPVAEIMFGDFLMLAADQLTNHAAKFSWMYDNQVQVPLVVRTPMGGRRGYGPTHSQCLEKHFLGVPGLWVVAPHVLGDPGALLQQSVLECDDPVLFIESKTCYPRPLLPSGSSMVTESFSDKDSPFPSTYYRMEGAQGTPDALLCAYGGMTPLCLEAVTHLREQEGLTVDLAVFTQLSPFPETHLRRLLEKVRPEIMVYAEEGSVTAGWSAEMMAQVTELCATSPRLPQVRQLRLGAGDLPIASSRELEWQSLPQVADIVNAVVNCF